MKRFSKIPAWATPVFFGVLLFVAAYRYALPVDQVLDIGFSDETRYLHSGLHLAEENLHALRAPLYAVWYAALSLAEPDPLALYDLNLRLQIILLPLALFVALLLARVPPFWAFLVSWGWLLTDANLEPWPRVSAFVWILLLLGVGLYQRFRASFKGWGFLLTAVGLSMYARPEMMLAFVLLAVLGLWKVKQGERRALFFWISALVALLAGLFGSPNEQGRLLEAFGQHFAFRWRALYLPAGLPWHRWPEVLNNAFGVPIKSFSDMLKANPMLVGKHVWANLLDTPNLWGKLLFSHTPYVLKDHPLWEGFIWAVAMLLAAAAKLWQLWRSRDEKVFWQTYGLTLLILVILALPLLGSIAVIYPHLHYLLGLTLLTWYAWALFVFGKPQTLSEEQKLQSSRSRPAWLYATAIAAVFLTATTPPITSHFGFSPILDLRQTLRTLQILQEESHVNAAAVPAGEWLDTNIGVYLPDFHFVPIDPKPSVFTATPLPDVPVIVLDNGNIWLEPPSARAFLINLENQGWIALCTSRKPHIILTRVLPSQDNTLPVKRCRLTPP